MEFGVGSIDEINYIAQIVEKQCKNIIDEQILKDDSIVDVKEYKYLKFLVFKYCLIPNAAL